MTGSVLVLAMCLGCGLAWSEERGPALTTPVVLPPFDPSAPSCTAPIGVQRVLAFARDNDRAFMMGIDRGLASALRDGRMDYRSTSAVNDVAKMCEQVDALLEAHVGGIVAAPVDPATLAIQVPWRGHPPKFGDVQTFRC